MFWLVVLQGLLLYRPDPTLTPGRAVETDTAVLCHGWSAVHPREVTAKMKQQTYAAYRVEHVPGRCCEVDHLIPRELGGADSAANLWPQPYPDAYRKDSVENWTHARVCAGHLDVRTAQNMFATDWTILYRAMEREKASP
jgi:hypothetical protein